MTGLPGALFPGSLRGRAAVEAAATAIGRPLLAPRELDGVLATVTQGLPHRPLVQQRVFPVPADPAASTVYVLDEWSLLVTDADGRIVYAQARLAGPGVPDIGPWARLLTGPGRAGVESLPGLWHRLLTERAGPGLDVRIIPVHASPRLEALRIDWTPATGPPAYRTALFTSSSTTPIPSSTAPTATAAAATAPTATAPTATAPTATHPGATSPAGSFRSSGSAGDIGAWDGFSVPAPAVHPLAIEIAEHVVGAARGPWQRLLFTVATAGSVSSAVLAAEGAAPGGGIGTTLLDPPTSALLLARRLRTATAAPDRGAWFGATVTVATATAGPAVEVAFDFDGPPHTLPPASLDALTDDLARFPRDAAHLPGWLRATLTGEPTRTTQHRATRRYRLLVGALAGALVLAGAGLAAALTLPDGSSSDPADARLAAGPAASSSRPTASSSSGAGNLGAVAVSAPYRGRLGSRAEVDECTLRGRITGDLTVTVVPAGQKWTVRVTLPSAMGGGGHPLDMTGSVDCADRASADDPATGRLSLDLGASMTARADGKTLPRAHSDTYGCLITGTGLQCFDASRRKPYTVEFTADRPPSSVQLTLAPAFTADARFTDLQLGTSVTLDHWRRTSRGTRLTIPRS